MQPKLKVCDPHCLSPPVLQPLPPPLQPHTLPALHFCPACVLPPTTPSCKHPSSSMHPPLLNMMPLNPTCYAFDPPNLHTLPLPPLAPTPFAFQYRRTACLNTAEFGVRLFWHFCHCEPQGAPHPQRTPGPPNSPCLCPPPPPPHPCSLQPLLLCCRLPCAVLCNAPPSFSSPMLVVSNAMSWYLYLLG